MAYWTMIRKRGKANTVICASEVLLCFFVDRQYQSSVKKYLHQYLQVDRVLDKDDMAKVSKSVASRNVPYLHNPFSLAES